MASAGLALLAVGLALWALMASELNIGPKPREVAGATWVKSTPFKQGIALALAASVDQLLAAARAKAWRINVSIVLALSCVVLLAFIRIVGGHL